MAARITSLTELLEEHAESGDPGFLVDVIARDNGKLQTPSLMRADWITALAHAAFALGQGFTVEIEESDGGGDESLLPGQIDRQD